MNSANLMGRPSSYPKSANPSNDEHEAMTSRWPSIEKRGTPCSSSDEEDDSYYHVNTLESDVIQAYAEKIESYDSSDKGAIVTAAQSLIDDLCTFNNTEKLNVANQLVDAFPDSAVGYLCVGQIYEMQGNLDRAIQTYHDGVANTTLSGKDILSDRLRSVQTVDFAARLPYEILEYLLCLLEPPDLVKCLNVSRLWRDRIADCPTVWRQVIVEHEEDIPIIEVVLPHVRRLQLQYNDSSDSNKCLDWIIDGHTPRLEMLSFRQADVDLPLPSQFRDAFQQAQNTLTELHLFFEWDDEGPSLMSVLSACPRVTHLIYYTSDPNGLFGNDIHPLTPCALTHLRLNCSQKYIIENPELGAILSRCLQLRYFDVKPCDPSALDVIQRHCQHLEYLRCNTIVNSPSNYWYSTPLTEQGEGLQLRSFSMTGYGNMTARNVMPILDDSKETLEELTLIDDRQYGRQHVEWWDPLVDFASNRLRSLEFSIDHHIHVLPSIIRQCPALQTVDLVQFASNDVFESLLTLSNLQQLSLSGSCNRMSEAGLMGYLAAVATSTTLRKIEFSGLEHIVTDTSVLLLANICNLRELKLGFCRSLTGQGMDAFLWKMKHSTLECLTLELMDSLTDSGLDWLGKLAHINKIKLEMCNKITDAGIRHLMGDLRGNLKFLRVHLCDEVSMEMANIIEKRFPVQQGYEF